jgi:integrase
MAGDATRRARISARLTSTSRTSSTGCSGPGCGSARPCAVSDEVLDLDAGTVEVNATVVRVAGRGLVVQRRTKSEAGWRVLALPPDLVALVRRRREELRVPGPEAVATLGARGAFGELRNPGILLTSATGSLRDPRNTNRDLRWLLDGLDCEACQGSGYQLGPDGAIARDEDGQPTRCDAGPFAWVTSHTFRKTVATRMEEAGCTPREVADQLGHSRPSMTQDVYFGRSVVTAKAAKILARPTRPTR